MIKIETLINSYQLKDKIISYFTSNDRVFKLDADLDLTHEGYDTDTDSSGAIYYMKDDYYHKAWMRFIIKDESTLYFGLIPQKRDSLKKYVYSWYHSELSRIILNEFDDDIKSIYISSQLIEGIDIIKSNT